MSGAPTELAPFVFIIDCVNCPQLFFFDFLVLSVVFDRRRILEDIYKHVPYVDSSEGEEQSQPESGLIELGHASALKPVSSSSITNQH